FAGFSGKNPSGNLIKILDLGHNARHLEVPDSVLINFSYQKACQLITTASGPPAGIQCDSPGTRDMASNQKRPINLDIRTIHLPIAAWASITHRITGVLLFVGIAGLLYLFDLSLSGQAGFAAARDHLTSPLAKFVLWIVLSALAYHMVAGIKHLMLDAGIAETKEGGPRAARLVIGISLVLVILLGVWLW